VHGVPIGQPDTGDTEMCVEVQGGEEDGRRGGNDGAMNKATEQQVMLEAPNADETSDRGVSVQIELMTHQWTHLNHPSYLTSLCNEHPSVELEGGRDTNCEVGLPTSNETDTLELSECAEDAETAGEGVERVGM
jgi:hypothetical protein